MPGWISSAAIKEPMHPPWITVDELLFYSALSFYVEGYLNVTFNVDCGGIYTRSSSCSVELHRNKNTTKNCPPNVHVFLSWSQTQRGNVVVLFSFLLELANTRKPKKVNAAWPWFQGAGLLRRRPVDVGASTPAPYAPHEPKSPSLKSAAVSSPWV